MRELLRKPHCLPQSEDLFQSQLYRAMAEKGFVYREGGWQKSMPREIDSKLMLSGFRIVREIEIKFVAENTDSSEILQITEHRLKTLDEIDRLLIYADLFPNLELLGLSNEQREMMYRSALMDIVNLTRVVEAPVDRLLWRGSRVYPLEIFMEKVLPLAASNRLISDNLSRDYITQVLSAPWFNKKMASYFASAHLVRSHQQYEYPYFRWGMNRIMQNTLFDQNLAENIFFDIQRPIYEQITNNQEPYPWPYHDLLWLAQQILQSGKLNGENFSRLQSVISYFERGAEFQRATAHLPNTDSKAMYLIDQIKNESDFPFFSSILARFLILNNESVNSETKSRLIHHLISKSERLDFSQGNVGYLYLAHLPFTVTLSKADQESIFHFISRRVGLSDSGLQFIMLDQIFRWRPSRIVPRLESAQKGLESLAESFVRVPRDPHLLYQERYEGEFSNANRLIENLKTCYPEIRIRASVCGELLSVSAILNRIASNPRVHPEIRRKAQELVH